jgi:hypothetical protein
MYCCHWVLTQLQLTNIIYIISYHIYLHIYHVTSYTSHIIIIYIKHKIQPKCSDSFLCCIIKQSTSCHPTFFTSKRSICPPTYLCQKDERNLRGNNLFPSNTRRISVSNYAPTFPPSFHTPSLLRLQEVNFPSLPLL